MCDSDLQNHKGHKAHKELNEFPQNLVIFVTKALIVPNRAPDASRSRRAVS